MRPRRQQLLIQLSTFHPLIRALAHQHLPGQWLHRVQWLHSALLHIAVTRSIDTSTLHFCFLRLGKLFQHHGLPATYSFDYHNTTCVVFIKVSLTHKAWYIGSTVHNAFSRDLTRHRKLRSLQSGTMGYYEPALHFWHRCLPVHQWTTFPLRHVTDLVALRAIEASMIHELQPQLNSPGVFQSHATFFLTSTNTGQPGRRMLRRLHRRRLRCDLSSGTTF